jgi:hypothetical protein
MKNTAHSQHLRMHYNPDTAGPRNRFIHAFTTTDFDITAVRKLWRDWLALHTIDPDEVLVKGFVHRSEEMYTVSYESAEITHRGPNHNGIECITYKTVIINGQKELVTRPRCVQLESAPLIFPYLAIDRILHERQTIEQENSQS